MLFRSKLVAVLSMLGLLALLIIIVGVCSMRTKSPLSWELGKCTTTTNSELKVRASVVECICQSRCVCLCCLFNCAQLCLPCSLFACCFSHCLGTLHLATQLYVNGGATLNAFEAGT